MASSSTHSFSYRVYLQHVSSIHSPQFHSSDEANIRTSSILVKVSETTSTRDLNILLRKKLELSCPEFFPNIKGLNNNDPVLKRDQDSLVLVLTSPTSSIHFYNHENMDPVQDAPLLYRNLIQPSAVDPLSLAGASSSSYHGESILKEPFHMIRSLKTHEFPAQVQRVMVQQYLSDYKKEEEKTTTAHADPLALDIRWFFIPSPLSSCRQPGAISPLFPTFIDLDGYCTGGESSDEDLTEDEDDCSGFGNVTTTINHPLTPLSNPPHTHTWIHHRRKMTTLCHAIASHQYECITGYLLKQSKSDPFVWRRVRCILVDDSFWWVYRTKAYSDDPRLYIGKQGCISLTGATVLEANNPSIPHVFEVSSPKGVIYTFRSNKRSVLLKWMNWLSSRIASCHCDHWMAMADLIIGDETMARFSKLDVSNVKNSSV